MWDIADITQWASETGNCLFFRTDADQSYALVDTLDKEVHIIPLPDEAKRIISETAAKEEGVLIADDIPDSPDPQELITRLQEAAADFVVPEGTVVKMASEAHNSAWSQIEHWFGDYIYDDAVSHHSRLQDDLNSVLDDEDDDPAEWTEDDINRYQYIYLPVLNQLYGAYLLDGDTFTEVKEHSSPLYSSCSRLYLTHPFLLRADDNGYPVLYQLKSSEQEVMELIQVGDWAVLLESVNHPVDD